MGELADEIIDRILSGDAYEYDEWWPEPSTLPPGVARPDRVADPLEFKDCTKS